MLKENKRIVYIVLIVVVVLAVIGAAYLTFIYTPRCENYECWQKYMSKCSRATFVNDEPEAAWMYDVEGKNGNLCDINVELLVAKQGELGIDKLVGQSMVCSYPIGVSTYAEKDLGKCHGVLKEELQSLIINKLHSYLIDNLGKIGEELGNSAI
jgi:hypothetical protein